jgi:KipI family sensor histidine kinase inhibitor
MTGRITDDRGNVGQTPILRISPSGDSAVLVEASGSHPTARWAAITTLRRHLLETPFTGYVDLVSTFEHLFVGFDPIVTDYEDVARTIHRLSESPATTNAAVVPVRHFRVPVVFGGSHGPDLEELSRSLSKTQAYFVEALTSADLTLGVVGASMEPIFDLGDSAPIVPRRAAPRPRVPAGSVSLASANMAIYPFASPGGWQLIGLTPLITCDIRRDPPVAYRPGDTFRLFEIPLGEWDDWGGQPMLPTGVAP